MIDDKAIVHPRARLGSNVSVGPFTVIGEHVRIGSNTRVGAHVVIDGHTEIGADNEIYPFCSIGLAPQDKKYGGEPTRLVIGARNTIREYCSFNTGTVQEQGLTSVGDDNWIMAYVHVAHDCRVGNHTIFANNATLAGHVSVGDWAILGGFTGVHQFVRIGAHSFCGVGTVLLKDLPPFVTVSGNPARPRGINTEGLKRRGFDARALSCIKQAYKTLYRSALSLEEAREAINQLAGEHAALSDFASFIATTERGLVR